VLDGEKETSAAGRPASSAGLDPLRRKSSPAAVRPSRRA